MQIPPHFTNIQHGLQTRPATAGRPGHAQPPDHPHYRRPAHGPFRGQGSLPALSARRADRRGHAPRGPTLPPRRDHDQHLPAAKLVAIERGRAVRPEAFRIDQGPRVLHRRQGSRPLRGLGLREAAAGDSVVSREEEYPRRTVIAPLTAAASGTARRRHPRGRWQSRPGTRWPVRRRGGHSGHAARPIGLSGPPSYRLALLPSKPTRSIHWP